MSNDIDVGTYVGCYFGSDGCQPGEIEVWVECDDDLGYRWADEGDNGEWVATEAEAIAQAEEVISNEDETPDLDETLDAVVATGYFGTADASDIRRIVECAASYCQGYILLPCGEVPAEPIGRLWTTNGYLQGCEYIALSCDASLELTAHELLRAVEDDDEGV